MLEIIRDDEFHNRLEFQLAVKSIFKKFKDETGNVQICRIITLAFNGNSTV